MRLSVHLGPWSFGVTAADHLALTLEAERLGFHAVWTAEAYGSDAVTPLAWLAAQTTTIRLGSGIMQMPGRSPAMTAMTAATLDQLSGGRFLLGLGPSGPQVSEGWHGVRFGRQLQRTREYVEVVRTALERKRLRYQGQTIELPLADGPGVPLALTIAPVQQRIPIYLASIGPRNNELTGEIADGWMPMLLSPEHLDQLLGPLHLGAKKTGRDLARDFDISPSVWVHIDEDRGRARDAIRPLLGLYVGGMGSRERNFYADMACRYGFEAEVRRVQDLYLGGDKRAALAALPERLIDLVTICGPRDRVRQRLRTYAEAGVTTLALIPIGASTAERCEQLRRLAALHRQIAT